MDDPGAQRDRQDRQQNRSLRPPLLPVARLALAAAGWVFLVVGVAGVFLPLLPGTVFLILAVACFARASPRFEAWLLDHPRLGPPILRWRATGAIPRSAKLFALVSLAASWALLFPLGAPAAVKAACLAIFSAVALFIGTRPGA